MPFPAAPPLAVFYTHIDIHGPFSPRGVPGCRCWLWTGRTNGAANYGIMQVGKEHGGWHMLAHRFSYVNRHGPIPPGLVIDHLCRNTLCVNPLHLEAVTIRENILRGTSWAAQHAAKTHCPAGHPYDAANTRISVAGSRICKACDREKSRRRYARRTGRAA